MRFSAGVAITVLTTLVIAAVAYRGVSVATHRSAERIAAPTPTPESPGPPLVEATTAPTPEPAPDSRVVVRDGFALDPKTA